MSALTSPIEQNPPVVESVEEIVRQLGDAERIRLWGPVASFFLSMCTFGLLPLFVWLRRWTAFAKTDRQSIVAAASFWRRRASPEDAAMLDAQVLALEPQTIYAVVPILVLIFGGLLVFAQLNNGLSMEGVIHRTISYGAHQSWTHGQDEISVHIVWVTALLIGYFCHWFAVRAHVSAAVVVANITGKISGSGVTPILKAGSGLNAVWIILFLGMCHLQAWWGVPLVLCGALQRQYVRKTSPRIRRILAEQLKGGSQAGTVVAPTKDFCRTDRCAAPIRTGANFCARCGAAV